MTAPLVAAAMLVLFVSSAFAAPAPWYRWRSKLDGTVACAQTSPGEGWERIGGPYRDARCEKTGRPGA
jgi:hypothetical protein